MDYTFLVIIVSVVCAIITLISILAFFISLCRYKKLQHFQSALYSSLFITDIGTIFASAVRESTKTPSSCSLAHGLDQFFNISYFLFCSSIVVFVTVLVHNKTLFFLSDLKNNRRSQVIYVTLVWILAGIITGASFVYSPSISESGKCIAPVSFFMFRLITWVITVVFNFSFLAYVYCVLSKASRSLSSERYHLRIVLSIALIMGTFRIPSYALALAVRKNLPDVFNEGQYGIGYFGLFASALTVLQSTFVVLVILFNHKIFVCCATQSTTDSSQDKNNTETSNSNRAARRSDNVALSVVATDND